MVSWLRWHHMQWRSKERNGKHYDAVVETDGRIRLNTSVHLQKGLKVLVAVPRSDKDSALSGIALSEPSLTDDWLNPDEEEAWAHLQ